MTSSRVLTALLTLLVAAALVSFGLTIGTGSMAEIVANTIGFISVVGLLIAHLRGWRWSPQATVILITLLVATSPPSRSDLQALYLFDALIPAILAIVLLPWYWSAGAFLVALAGTLAQTGLGAIMADPALLLVLLVMAGGCSLAAIVSRTAQQRAEDNAARVGAALDETRVQKLALEQKAAELAERNEQQRRLLDLVTTLETPAVALADGVLLVPVVGNLDSRRAQALTGRLLTEVNDQRARLVVIDIAGVTAVDTEVAQALLRAEQAVRLLGCNVIITGISASIATTLTHLGINLESITAARTPQEALSRYLESTIAIAPYGSN